jgi:ABC-type lipoprotein release transport system permease subunit
MKEIIKIAWRNLWRNRRRTLITVASIFFALILALFMRSMQLGSYDSMIENAVRTSTGYIQIHANGYWDDKSINNSFENTPRIKDAINEAKNITHHVPRLESFTLCSHEDKTKGVMLIGIDPVSENNLSRLKGKVEQGKYLEPDDQGLILGKGLAEYLEVTLGDSIVLLSQGYHGVTAAGLYPVIGIADLIVPSANNSMIYTTLVTAQEFYGVPNGITSISIMLDDPDEIAATTEILRAIDPENLEVMTWDEMLPELVQGIESDNISGLFMLGILYIVIGFGILGTIIMMTMERRKEFGIMVAVGMRRSILVLILFSETVIIGFLGIASGVIASLPLLGWFKAHPIPLSGEAAEMMLEFNADPVMPFIMETGFYINQSVTVLIMAILAGLYPIRYISRLKVVKAIKGK